MSRYLKINMFIFKVYDVNKNRDEKEVDKEQ